MSLQAKQTIQQRLTLAPNIALALEVLRMPAMELQAFLNRQLEENPLLEGDEPEENAQASAEETNNDQPADSGFDEEWLSHWRTASEREWPDSDDFPEHAGMEQQLIVPQSLHESLRLQLGCQRLSPEQQRLGELIILQLNEYGYFEGSLDELAAAAGAGVERLVETLRMVQRLDPPGVGARDLRECLMIQLEQQRAAAVMGREPSGTALKAPSQAAMAHVDLAYRILTAHFALFAQHRLRPIARATGASIEQVAEAYQHLRQLNPRPGCIFASDLPPSIVPDLIIHHREQHYDVELNEQDLPHIRVSRSYYRMLRDPRTPEDARAFLSTKLRNARWLMKAIEERHTTLLSIARCLISLQRDSLEHGPRALKPLTQAQVAGLVGRHASTVSRAIAGKTIDTPFGVVRLEQFFTSAVHQADDTHAISDQRIKAELQRLVTEEDPHHPRSDAALASQLAQRQIRVARRTIAKYRVSLKILPAHLRRNRL